MEGILPLAGLLAASGSFLYISRLNRQRALEGRVAGFEDLINPDVEDAMGDEHTQYVRDSASRFNPLMNLINPAENPLLPPDFTSEDVYSSTDNVKSALVSAIANPENPSFMIKPSDTSDIMLNTGSGGTGFQAITKCESIKTLDCNSFNDKDFAANCGICHEGGVNSGANKVLGGLFVLDDDKENAEAAAKRMGSKRPNYTPSVGKCNPGRFTINKAQCERLKKQMECESKQTYDINGCSQCFQDGTFKFLDPDLQKIDAALILAGTGTLKVTKVGSAFNATKELSNSQGVKIEIPTFNEGDVLQLEINGTSPSLSGYLVGTTIGGEFRLDINRLIQIDSVTNAKPSLSGFLTIAGENYTLMRPGRDKTTAKFNLQNVFTFINSNETEAAQCATAPYVTKQNSAEFLQSGTCYKKGNRPGEYSMDCLKEIFTSSGCEGSGTAYPDTTTKMTSLMMDSRTGKALSIGEIAANIYAASLSAYSGTDGTGAQLGIKDWDIVSRFCTGKSITSPCDMDNKGGGPLSSKCLSYLWKNQGAIDKLPGGIGPTYTNTPNTTSLTSNNNRYCTPNGTMSPINAQGQLNQTAFNTARTKGGVEGVKSFYNSIHQKANDNTLKDSDRKEAIQQCYGIALNTLPGNMMIDDTVSSSSSPYTCVTKTTIPGIGQGNSLANINVTKNWKYSFTIRPTGVLGEWANIFQVTKDSKDYDGHGSRNPGVWFIPHETRMSIYITSKGDQFWAINTVKALPLNQDTNVTIELQDRKFTLTLSGGVTETLNGQIGTDPYMGPAQIFVTSALYTRFVGTLTNFTYCSSDGPVVSILDNKAGRTKTAFNTQNYTPIDWSQFRPVNVIASYGQGVWGRWWAPNFPDDGTAKWIWNIANAGNNDPSNRYKPFLKKYTNPTNNTIIANLYVAADNMAYMHINDKNVSTGWKGMNSWEIQLPPGESKIDIAAANDGGGGPAGLVVICKDKNGKTLFVSDGSWVTGSD